MSRLQFWWQDHWVFNKQTVLSYEKGIQGRGFIDALNINNSRRIKSKRGSQDLYVRAWEYLAAKLLLFSEGVGSPEKISFTTKQAPCGGLCNAYRKAAGEKGIPNWSAKRNCIKTGVDKWSNPETISLGLFSCFWRACPNTNLEVDQKVSLAWSKHTGITRDLCFVPGSATGLEGRRYLEKIFHLSLIFCKIKAVIQATMKTCGDKLMESY